MRLHQEAGLVPEATPGALATAAGWQCQRATNASNTLSCINIQIFLAVTTALRAPSAYIRLARQINCDLDDLRCGHNKIACLRGQKNSAQERCRLTHEQTPVRLL